jgi:toxin ParE1/3/4
MRLSISKRAKADIDEIWAYVAAETSIQAASRVGDSLSRCFRLLRRAPFAGRSREQDLIPGLRSISTGRYVVFYRAEDGVVRIVRVLHGSRDTQAILSNQ